MIELSKQIGGLNHIFMKKKTSKKSTRIHFDICLPTWIIDNKEIDKSDILAKEFKKQIESHRRRVPRNGHGPVNLYIIGDMRLDVDGYSAISQFYNCVIFTLSMDVYYSNAKCQHPVLSNIPYEE